MLKRFMEARGKFRLLKFKSAKVNIWMYPGSLMITTLFAGHGWSATLHIELKEEMKYAKKVDDDLNSNTEHNTLHQVRIRFYMM